MFVLSLSGSHIRSESAKQSQAFIKSDNSCIQFRSSTNTKMSLVPVQYRTWWDDWDLPLYTRVLEKSITQEVLGTDDFWRAPPLAPLRWSSLYRPWRYFSLRDVGAKVDTDPNRFQIELDVHQFLPHEVTVRRTDKYVTIEGKHEEKRDEQGYVARQFSRRYLVPIGYDANLIVSSLSSDGILTVTAPRIGLPAPKVENSRRCLTYK